MNAKWLKHSLRDGRGAVEYQIQPGEMMDGQVLKNCKERKVLGVLPTGAAYENGSNYIFSYVDKKETLAKCLSETVTQESILCSFESIANTLIHMKEQEIDLAYTVLDPEYIYMEEQKARLICIPGKNAVMQKEEIPAFFRNVLANAVYLNSEDGDYVAKLLSAINGDFELKSFLRVIHGLMMDAGIEIIEDKLEEPEEEKVEEVTEAPVAGETPEEVAEAPVAEETPEEVAETPVAEETPEEVAEIPVAEETPEEVAEAPAAEESPEEVAETPVSEETPEEVAEIPVTEETPAAEPEIPVTPVVSEVPQAPETSVETKMPETPVSQAVTSVIPEDDIEFEPMPEELAAKIKRTQGAPQPQVQSQEQPQVNAVPQSVVQPVAQPQASVTPQPMAQPQAGVAPQPIAQPQTQPQINPIPQPVAPVPQPTVQPQVQTQASSVPTQSQPQVNPAPSQPQMQPQANQIPQQPPIMTMPQPSGEPRPLIPPQPGMAPSQPAAKKPDPHLTRVKTGERIALQSNSFIIGKSQTEANYTVADNPAVSRVHCTILRKENGVYYVRDEHSTNNTFVNGEQVLPGTEKILLNNCKLVLGDEEFIYNLW